MKSLNVLNSRFINGIAIQKLFYNQYCDEISKEDEESLFVVGDTSPDILKQLIQTWRSLTQVMLG